MCRRRPTKATNYELVIRECVVGIPTQGDVTRALLQYDPSLVVVELSRAYVELIAMNP